MSGYNNFCVFLCVREGEIYIYRERNVVSCCGVIADRASVNVFDRERVFDCKYEKHSLSTKYL